MLLKSLCSCKPYVQSESQIKMLINPYLLKRRTWTNLPDYTFTESLGRFPAPKGAPVNCSQNLGCSLWFWPAVPMNKARLQAPRLPRDGRDQTLPPRFCRVISEAACKQRDFTPAESPFCNNITETPVFWSLAGLKHRVFSSLFYFTGWPGRFISSLIQREKGQGQWAVNIRQEHIPHQHSAFRNKMESLPAKIPAAI